MRIAIVTGIYPPDIGGPATHARDLASELTARGHTTTVVTLTDATSRIYEQGLVRFPRRWRWPIRFLAVVAFLARNARSADVVYATGMQTEAVVARAISRVPTIVKFVGDPAWERGIRLGLVTTDFDAFQTLRRTPLRVRLMRSVRTATARRADEVVVPSHYLADVVAAWTGGAVTPTVIPNGVRAVAPPRRDPVRDAPLEVVFVGRLVPWKNLDEVLRGLASCEDVRLVVVGDGPEEARLHELAADLRLGNRVQFVGAVSHDQTMGFIASADVLVSVSSYEGLPHTVIESLVAGTPVIASRARGTTEVITDGANGTVIAEVSAAAISSVLTRLRDDREHLQELAEGARRSGAHWTFAATADRVLERLTAHRDARAKSTR